MNEKTWIEWGIFDAEHNDYSFSLNKNTLRKINDWESIQTILYYNFNWKSINDFENWMRKKLVICLLSDDERRKNMSDAIVLNYTKESELVTIKISKHLLDNLLDFEWWSFSDDYEYRYNTGWDKMHFYVNDSHSKTMLNDSLKFYEEIFKKKSTENH